MVKNNLKLELNFINGEWINGGGIEREIINPANKEAFALASQCDRQDVRRAVKAAKEAFYSKEGWRRTDVQKKADVLLRIADEIENRMEEIAEIEAMNHGKPLREAQGDIEDGVHYFRYYAGLIRAPHGEVYDVNHDFGEMHTYTVQEPIGVCALITPWNYPFLMAVWKIAPALAAGNSIVFKPASVTPLSSIILFEILEKVGLPRGTANLVMGSGSEVGQELAENKDVDMLSFTGSTAVGQKIAYAAVGNMKKLSLELGGKSPNIIFADADLEGAVEWAMIGAFYNQGQICSAGARILVEESIKEKFVHRLCERAEGIVLGRPTDNPDMGPIVSQEQVDTVMRYIESGKKEGARCMCGGERYLEGACKDGYFIKPTVFDQCTPDMRIVKEEIFGPVMTVQAFRTEEEAVAMANDTIYGLGGMVFTGNGSRALRVAKEIRAGITWINCNNACFTEAPWGGYKMSGIGRDLGTHGLREFQETKQMVINLNPGIVGWYPDR